MKIFFAYPASILFLIFACTSLSPQRNNQSPKDVDLLILSTQIDSLVSARMASDQIPGAAVLLIKDGKVLHKKGYGFAHVERQAPFDVDSSIFRIGSISKTFTAMALLTLADQGKIKLDEDVNQYLKWVKVPDTFTTPVTPAHLITHSAGFDELGGRRVFQKNQLIALDSFLNNRLVRLRESGVVSSYSTYGIALAGLIVEDVSGQTLEEYMDEHIWSPLGMDMTSIEPPIEHQPFLASGYEMSDGNNVAASWEWYHTFPASSINSTFSDMEKYLKVLLNHGTYQGGKVLSKQLAKAMQSQQLSVHPEVFGFAYGFYERDRNGLKTFTHGGDMLGFSSMMTLIPSENMGILVSHHHEGTGLRNEVTDLITKHFGSAPQAQEAPDRLVNDVQAFAGTYRWMTTCYTCDNDYGFRRHELSANSDGTLSGFGRKFYQVEPLLFKSYDGQRIMGFKKDGKGEIRYMSLGNINAFEKIE